mmetsp:Transcript_31660/g.46709  ORF Transcript_31660/g.46709 Transcript_31660/m.46709 type:complete len:570 (-) Transcript_31660:53-1762(-)
MVRTRRSPTSKRNENLIIMVFVSLLSFYAGSLFSMQASMTTTANCPTVSLSVSNDHSITEELSEKSAESDDNNMKNGRFPETVHRFATGMSRINKDEFTNRFEMGVPVDQSKPGEEEVLLLYSSERALTKKKKAEVTGLVPIPRLSVEDATENCEEMHIVLTDHTNRKQCVALVPQYESFHIQKWMRVDGQGGKMDATEDLRHVSRGYQSNGREKFRPPEPKHTRRFWEMLMPYIQNIDKVLDKLRPLVEKVAKNNQLVVMVCNKGQSELLMNFVCSLKARGLDYSQVLLFATDVETKELAESMGVTAFYDEINFESMPSDAAKGYGDRRFVAMMLAKVFCVQLVSMLGYDFLFQDVDIVWYKNPFEYFDKNPQFDIYFQDDGAHSTRYAPYSANSGFYYVRHNDRTQFFLTAILMAGDLVIKTDSHQQALIAALSEHASLYGLKVKIMSRDAEEFPGGYQFHQKTGKYMRKFYRKELHPYIFHMSWTTNKDNKFLFLQQMGEWYLDDKCIQKTVDEIGAASDLQTECCHAEPIVVCHYRDKPSIVPCHDSPPIDKDKPSWWDTPVLTS